jgi:hypothetical protein
MDDNRTHWNLKFIKAEKTFRFKCEETEEQHVFAYEACQSDEDIVTICATKDDLITLTFTVYDKLECDGNSKHYFTRLEYQNGSQIAKGNVCCDK